MTLPHLKREPGEARAVLVGARTALVNAARGLAKSYGERLRKCEEASGGGCGSQAVRTASQTVGER